MNNGSDDEKYVDVVDEPKVTMSPGTSKRKLFATAAAARRQKSILKKEIKEDSDDDFDLPVNKTTKKRVRYDNFSEKFSRSSSAPPYIKAAMNPSPSAPAQMEAGSTPPRLPPRSAPAAINRPKFPGRYTQ